MKKTALIAALAAALGASGCTAATSTPTASEAPAASTPATAATTSAPAAPSEMPSASPSPSAAEYTMAKAAPGMESPNEEQQDYADIMLNIWLNHEGAHNIGDFNKPYSYITGWSSPSPNVYAFTIDNSVEKYAAKSGSSVETQLRKIGTAFKKNPAGVNIQPKRVHVSTADGKHETTVS